MALNRFTLGQALRAKREELGLRQDEVAATLHTTQGNLSRWERDLTTPKQQDAYRAVSAFLGVSYAELAGLIAESARNRVLKELALLQEQ
ncbi:MAG: helix-turn-helix transcriptional regulator [Actinomycetes bacterium]